MAGLVLVTYGGYAVDHPHCGAALRDAGLELRVRPRDSDRTPDELAALCDDAVAAIADADPFDASVLERCSRLKIIARTGVGLDSIDLDAARAHGVAVTVTPGINHETVAEHAVMLMLASLRALLEHDALVRGGGWRDFSVGTSQLYGSTVGVVGYGAIGSAVGWRVRAFGAEVIAHDPNLAEADVPLVGLDELLQRSDVVSVNAALTPATHHIIDAERIARMKPGAVLVNTSRGPLVDEQAVVDAVRRGHLSAAGLDVFEVEPPGQGPVTRTKGITLTPHVGGTSRATNLAMSRMATDAVLAVLDGRAPEHTVA